MLRLEQVRSGQEFRSSVIFHTFAYTSLNTILSLFTRTWLEKMYPMSKNVLFLYLQTKVLQQQERNSLTLSLFLCYSAFRSCQSTIQNTRTDTLREKRKSILSTPLSFLVTLSNLILYFSFLFSNRNLCTPAKSDQFTLSLSLFPLPNRRTKERDKKNPPHW